MDFNPNGGQSHIPAEMRLNVYALVIYIPDPGWTQQQEFYWWGITNPDGTPRPAYTSLKQYFVTNP